MTIVHNTDHVGDMLDMLIEQFKDKDIFQKLIAVYARQIQDLEDALIAFVVKQNIDLADGAYLDVLGGLVGEKRGGLNDSAYRAAIRIAAAQRSGGSTVNDLIDNIDGVHITSYSKTVIGTLYTVLTDEQFDQALALLKALVAAGVEAQLIEPSTDRAHAWIVGGSGNNSVGHGLIGRVGG